MWTDTLNRRNAYLIQHHVERLLEMDDKFDVLNPTEYNALCEILFDVKYYRENVLNKKRLCHANNPITTSSIR